MLKLHFILLLLYSLFTTHGIYVPNNTGIKTSRPNAQQYPGVEVYQNYTNVKIQQHENSDNLKKIYVDNYSRVNPQTTPNPRVNEQFDLEPNNGYYQRPQLGRVYTQYPQTETSQNADNYQVSGSSFTHTYQAPQNQPIEQFPQQQISNPQETLCTLNCIRTNQSPVRGYTVQFTGPSNNLSYPVGMQSTRPTSFSRPYSFYITRKPGTIRSTTISQVSYQPMRAHTTQYQPIDTPVYTPKPQNVIIPENYYSGRIQNVQQPQQPCKKCPSGATGQYPYENSCHQFLNCWNGRGIVQNCAPGTLFNPKTLECDYPDKVHCMSGPRTARYEKLTVKEAASCPEGFSGIVPHYQDCSKFLNCNNGAQVEMNCPPGTLFDTQSNVCDHAYKVQCVNQDQREIRYIESSKYTQGSPTPTSIPTPTSNPKITWSNQENQNNFPQQPNKFINSGVAKCPAGFAGLMPHPQDCAKFLSCANGMTFIMDCGPGTYFNPLISVCDHIRNVKCGQGQDSPSSTPTYSQNNQQNPAIHTGQYYPEYNPGQNNHYGGSQTNVNPNINHNQNYGSNPGQYYPSYQNGGQSNIYSNVPNQGNSQQHTGYNNPNNPHTQWRPQGQNYPNQNNGYHPQYANGNPSGLNQGSNLEDSNYNQEQSSYPLQFQEQNWQVHTIYIHQTTTLPSTTTQRQQYPAYNTNQHNQWRPQGQNSQVHISSQHQTTPASTTTTQKQQWNQNNHYTKPNQGRDYDPSQLANDNIDQQIEELWQTSRETTTSSYETLTPAQTTNRKKVWPPPFPSKRVDNDYHFDYEDLVEVDVPLPIKPLPVSKKLVQSESGKLQCTNQTFNCGNNFCINPSGVCNGQKDCPNGNDEQDCSLKLQDYIKTSGTKLAVKEVLKLPNVTLAWCAASCSKTNCKGFNFRKHDGTCYILDANVGTSGALIILPMYDYYENQQYTVDCSQNQGYLCKNQKCIPTSKVCDGINDCGDALDEKGCNADAFNYKLRLVGEEKHSGRLEIEVFGRVGYICDDMFGLKNADVACRELGFNLGAAEVRGNSFFASDIKDNETVYLMDDVTCTGNETSLRDCDFNGWGISNCKPQEIVGVICKTPLEICPKDHWKCKNNLECLPLAFVCDGVYDCTDKSDESGEFCEAPLKLRLTDGTQGRLEIMHNGIWGTVCDDDFNDDAAKVVCHQLGLTGSAKVVKDGQFGPGSGPIWLDQVFCRGNESALENCIHWDWGEHNCEHSEDVGVICNIKSVPGIERRQKVDVVVKPDDDESKLPERCGYRKDAIFNLEERSAVHFRVVQGGTAQVGEYPWQASIRINGKTKSAHWCGAIVISSKYILTAAHCLVGYSKGAYFIVAGDYHVDKEEGTEQAAYIEDFVLHPKFGHGNKMNNDIALIRLKGKGLKITKDVQPVCLPPADLEYPVGLNCTISGFGSIESGKSKASRELRAGWIPILSKDICQMPHVYGDSITEGMLCAGFMENGVDACDGDSGGPLACLHEGVFKVFGITSWGQHCGYANKPGVYVNVAKYRRWIENTMKKLST